MKVGMISVEDDNLNYVVEHLRSNDFDVEIICKCGLNPNETQSENQQKWEEKFIVENGMCNACYNEEDERNEDK